MNNIDSPTGLEKKKPTLTKRVGKKPMMLVLSVMAVIALWIVFNIVTHTGSNIKSVNSEEEAGNLAPATQIAEDLTSKMDMTNQSATSSGTPNLSADNIDQQLDQERQTKLKAAMEASTDVEPFTQKSKEAEQLAQNEIQGGNQRMIPATSGARTGMNGIATPIVPPLAGDETAPDQNMQSQKEAFLEKATQNQYAQYLDSTRKPALSPFELKVGTVIPCTLVDGINSDLPGEINAQVSEDVYDTRAGRYLLIPQGTKVFGKYDSRVAYGQNGLLIVWQRLTFPDASSLELEGMTGSDKGGYAGFRDQVDNHYGRLIGFGLATSAFSSLFQISQKDNNSTNGTLTPSQIAAATTAQSMTQLGIDVTRRNLNIQPTIKIRPGYRFVIKVDRDVMFPSPYIGK